MKRKNLEIFLDAGILLTGLLLLIIVLSGGFELHIGDKTLGLRSFRNPLILFLILFAIRSLKFGNPFSRIVSKYQGAAGVWAVIFAIFALISIYLASVIVVAASNNQPELSMDLQQAKGSTSATSFHINGDKIRLKSLGQHKLEFQLASGDVSDFAKIRFNFDRDAGNGTQNLTSLNLVYKNADGDVIRGLARVNIVKGIFIYDLPLVDNDFDTIHVVLVSNFQQVNAEITKISLLPPDAFDYKYFASALALIIAFLLIFPGLLIVSILTARGPTATVLLTTFFAASLCYYLCLYLVLELSYLLQYSQPGILITGAMLLSIASLVYLNFRQDRFRTLNDYIYTARIPFSLFTLILLLLTAYSSFDTVFPFQNLGWQSISGPKTFNVFSAHDNYFQFANGRVIAENLPFSDEYGVRGQSRPLFFYAEDREILPGVIYSVFRSFISVFDSLVGKSYFTYTIFGIAMNLMIIFPLLVLARRFVTLSSIAVVIIAALLFGNAVLIAQSSLTWFKFCGAALFLSGLVILINDRSGYRPWLLGGLCFGLAVNMHSAVALGIPFYFLWLLYQKGKEEGFSLLSWLSGPTLLVITFMIVNLPWKLVKKIYLHDSIVLPVTFLFGGYEKNNNLVESGILFFQSVPLAEQISFRMQRLLLSFRLDEAGIFWQQLTGEDFSAFLSYWTHLEFGYTVFFYYPLLLILLLGFIVKKMPVQMNWPFSTGMTMKGTGHNRELISLIVIGIVTQLMIVFASYNHADAADIGWAQPLGVTLLVYSGLLLLILQQKGLAFLLIIYTIFSYFRLFLSYANIP